MKVVFMTMGDGSEPAAGMLSGTGQPSPDHLVALGHRRHSEAIAALASLGVAGENAVFLGYPDGGLADIVDNRHWRPNEPYTSKHTGRASRPYASSFTPGAEYCASRIVSDLAMIFTDYMPDLVLLAHPLDTHSDHWATYALAMFAIEHLDYVELTGARVLAYMVHAGANWPQPWGYRPDLPLDPPQWRGSPQAVWIRASLTEDAIAAKLRALEQYKSQLVSLSAFLKSFIRSNELFSLAPVIDLAPPHEPGSPQRDDAPLAQPGPRPFRVLPPSCEIRSVAANRIEDGIAVTATLAWRPSPSVTYRLQMVSPMPAAASSEPLCQEERSRVKELIYEAAPYDRRRRPWAAMFLISLQDLESLGAKALIEVVTLRRGAVVDRSGWILLRMRSAQ